MPLPRFRYEAATSLEHAGALLAEHGDHARLLAGGTDLLLHLRHGRRVPEVVVGLKGISALHGVRVTDRALVIGAMARLAEVGAHPVVARQFPALRQAIAACATVQIRNMGTVVGNLCNASPSADTAPPLLAHDAVVLTHGPKGPRRLPLGEFFTGPGRTALHHGELVTAVEVPLPGTPSALRRISQRGVVDIAAVIVAVALRTDEGGRCTHARVALGAVAPTPRRAESVEALLLGQVLTDTLIEEAGATASAEAQPISDLRASAGWRTAMVKVMTEDAIREVRR